MKQVGLENILFDLCCFPEEVELSPLQVRKHVMEDYLLAGLKSLGDSVVQNNGTRIRENIRHYGKSKQNQNHDNISQLFFVVTF